MENIDDLVTKIRGALHDTKVYSIRPINPDRTSLINSAYLLETSKGAMVFRINTSIFGAWKTKKEVSILNALVNVIPVPKVLASSWESDVFKGGFIAMGVCPGVNAVTCKTNLQQSFFVHAANILGRLHQIEYGRPGFLHDFSTVGTDIRWQHLNYKEPLPNEHDLIMAQTSAWLEHLTTKGSRYAPALNQIHQRMGEFGGYYSRHENRFVHGDYSIKNMITNGEDITGLLDFEFSRSGDRSSDLYHFIYQATEEAIPTASIKLFTNTYSKLCGVPDHFDKKCQFLNYLKAFEKVIILKAKLERSPPESHEKIKKDLYSWLQQTLDEGVVR